MCKLYYLCPTFSARSDARVAEEARLESVYTSKAYPEFESRSLRNKRVCHNYRLKNFDRALLEKLSKNLYKN